MEYVMSTNYLPPNEQLLAEAEKMLRVPGIIFADSVCGRVARVAGTGLEVFEIIIGYRSVGYDWRQLKEAYHWLSDNQLRAALTYYELYPEEINGLLEENDKYTPEYVYEKYPFMKPKPR
jgi:uncharacterized protein (DUF433 family)